MRKKEKEKYPKKISFYLEEKEKELINRQTALRQQERMLEDREQEVNKREAKMQSFLGSSIGKKAMQEYVDEAKNVGTEMISRRGKHAGKIKVINEREVGQ